MASAWGELAGCVAAESVEHIIAGEKNEHVMCAGDELAVHF